MMAWPSNSHSEESTQEDVSQRFVRALCLMRSNGVARRAFLTADGAMPLETAHVAYRGGRLTASLMESTLK